jgi:hypothetical protein
MSALALPADDPPPQLLAATVSAWRHALAHGDSGGRLALYRRALSARILVGDPNLDVARADRLADSLVVARLARGKILPAGWWPATLKRHGASLLDAGWDEVRLVWPVLIEAPAGTPPAAEDLLVLDRRDRAAWGLTAGAAGALLAAPLWQLEMAVAGERPLRLHRHPWDWLAAVTRQQEAPEGDPGGGAAEAARTLHLCLLDPRCETAERVLAGAARLLCDDLDHAEQVKRWQRALLPPPRRPEILVPAAPAAEGAAA